MITGQDAEIESVKSILAGEQYSSIFKDTSKLAETTVNMIKQIAEKKTVEVNDTKSYDNGVKVVPTMLLQPGRSTSPTSSRSCSTRSTTPKPRCPDSSAPSR